MHSKSILAILFLIPFPMLTLATEIRVKNGSDVDFKEVVVGGKAYGDIKPGAATEYQTWKKAYRYSSVTLKAGDKPLKIQPIDYVGETPLGDGKFSYILTIKDGRLEIKAEKDTK